MDLKHRMNAIYRDLGLDEIPWNIAEPPGALVELLESGRIEPCDAVDLGCGTGNHVVWLASMGFRMTGIDLSNEAIELAKRHASERHVSCRFLVANLSDDLSDLDEQFDLAFDWKVLHHVFPEHRLRWVANVHRMLRPGGTYVSVCFSDQEPTGFPGAGKYRETPLGTTLYLSSESELLSLFGDPFEIESLETILVPGKSQPHTAVKAVMSKVQ